MAERQPEPESWEIIVCTGDDGWYGMPERRLWSGTEEDGYRCDVCGAPCDVVNVVERAA